MNKSRRKIVASLISALKGKTSDQQVRGRLLKIASLDTEIRKEILPILLEESNDRFARLAGKHLRLAYERPEVRDQSLLRLHFAMGKMAMKGDTGGFPLKDFMLWADKMGLKGRSKAEGRKGEEVSLSYLADRANEEYKDPLKDPDVSAYFPRYQKCRSDEACWGKITEHKKQKAEGKLKEKKLKKKFEKKQLRGKIKTKLKKKKEKTPAEEAQSVLQKAGIS